VEFRPDPYGRDGVLIAALNGNVQRVASLNQRSGI
jgi:hypothetical protein